MAVGIKVDFFWYPIGNGSFVHSFFSTISYNLENQGWGSRFPYLLNKLYQGELSYKDVDNAREELIAIRKEFESYPPDKIVWDIDNLNQQPPWGKEISSEITSIANYFITCDGKDLFDEIIRAFSKAQMLKQNILLVSL